jgi:hypothetical protein
VSGCAESAGQVSVPAMRASCCGLASIASRSSDITVSVKLMGDGALPSAGV